MKKQDYLDHLVGVFGHPVAENPGVIIQEAAFRALGGVRHAGTVTAILPAKVWRKLEQAAKNYSNGQ